MNKITERIDYETVMAEIAELMARGVNADTPEGDRLLELVAIARRHEAVRFPRVPPDPVSAIRFRMEQDGLQPRDLIPYLGNRSRVYEVLSGKRSLTLPMIRSLHQGLGIPAESLIAEPIPVAADDDQVDWDQFPVAAMRARGWIFSSARSPREERVVELKRLIAPLEGAGVQAVLYRKSVHVRATYAADRYALLAWTAHVVGRAMVARPAAPFQRDVVTPDFLSAVAHLSWSDRGPRLAEEFLAKHGIALVIEPQLPGARLDGAAFWFRDHEPVVALTLRYDRLDSFWFCLLHELAHVARHLTGDLPACYDDLDAAGTDAVESEADQVAGDALIPPQAWTESNVMKAPSPRVVEDLARTLRVHPAVVAGRVRHELGNYRLLSKFVGQGEVRRQFPEVVWSAGNGGP